jgi:hypothetical protein
MNASDHVGCLPGTRVDLLKSIEDWTKDTSSQQSVLWLHGLAGAGKTTISITIADRLRAARRACAFLLFERGVTERNDPDLVIRTIAYQMASCGHYPCGKITAAIERSPNISSLAPLVQFQRLIAEPLAWDTQKTAGNSREGKGKKGGTGSHNMPAVVLLDALDECGDPRARQHLLAILAKETAGLGSVLRFIVTSRAEYNSDIRNAFENQVHIIPCELDITSDVNTMDILLYSWHHAKETRNANQYPRLPADWPGEHVIQELGTRASGLFLWAATAWAFVNSYYPQQRLEMLLHGYAPYIAETTLDALYRIVLESAGAWQDENFVHGFRLILGTVIALKDPLSSTAIDRLLDLPSDQPSLHTISRLGCVLSQSPTVRVLHLSFADFLCNRARCGRDIWFFDAVAHNQHIAMRCLQILNGTLRRNICNLTLSADMDTEVLPEEIAYACAHWIDHICEIKNGFPFGLFHLETFLNQHLLHWFEAMSILKSRNTTTQLNNLSAWLAVSSITILY